MSEAGDTTTYRHKHDASVRYEVRGLGNGSYEVRRVDNPEIFGSDPFVVSAQDFEAVYEPVQERA